MLALLENVGTRGGNQHRKTKLRIVTGNRGAVEVNRPYIRDLQVGDTF